MHITHRSFARYELKSVTTVAFFLLDYISWTLFKQKMKEITLFFLLHIISFASFGQEIKIKKGKIYLDKKACMTLEVKKNSESFLVYDASGQNELLFYSFNDNRTADDPSDDKCRIVFTSLYKSLVSKELLYMPKKFIMKLFEEGLFDENGDLIEEQIDPFIKKYDEDQIRMRSNRNKKGISSD